MKKIFSLATILGLILSYTSCTSVKTIVINVQKPAQITLPKTVDNVGIVNNAIPQPESLGHIDYKYTKKGERINEKVNVSADSACYILTETLFEELADQNYFKDVSLYEFGLREDLDFAEDRTIDSLKVKELCDRLNSDIIISLDRFFVNTVYHEESYDFQANLKFLDLKMETVFRAYSKDGNQMASPFYFSDSIFWSAAYTPNNTFLLSEDSIPAREDAIKEAAAYAAQKIAAAFGPTWIDRPRVYYGDNKEANKMFEANNWQEALSAWEKSFDSETKMKKKARLANNIALTYELSDNIKEALKWAQTSVQLFTESAETSVDRNNLSVATSYYNELMDRYKDFRIFDMREKEE